MKPVKCLLPEILCTLLLLSCHPASKSNPNNAQTQKMIAERQDLTGSPESGSYDEAGQPIDKSPKIALSQNEHAVLVINTNLDLDMALEQIIVVQNIIVADSPLKLIVADYDEIRKSYLNSWSALTQCTNPSALRIETEDLTGDFNWEILCYGMNLDGELTLDVMKKIANPKGISLYFVPILQLKADLSIVVQRQERPQSYQLKQSTGANFPIVIEYSEKTEGERIDTVKETYFWKLQDGRYQKSITEKIKGDIAAQKKLMEILSPTTSSVEYMSFLRGMWFHSSQSGIYIVISPEDNSIVLYNGKVLEHYAILGIIRYGYRITLKLENSVLNSIKMDLDVVIKSLNSLDVNIKDSDNWDGAYQRMTDEMSEFILAKSQAQEAPTPPLLAGIYTNDANAEEVLVFDDDLKNFSWISDAMALGSGTYYLIKNVGILNPYYLKHRLESRHFVVSFRYVVNNRFIKDENYLIEYSETSTDDIVTKTIRLTPVLLRIEGAEIIKNESISFRQTQTPKTDRGNPPQSQP